MNATSLQAALDVVVVGHLDGHGRSLLWRTPGARSVAAAVQQAGVLPGRFDREPGWVLRPLPDGRVVFLTGGTQHPQLADAFGRSGIFCGAGIVGAPQDVATALGAPDATALCMQLARAAMRGMGTSAQLAQACQAPPMAWSGQGDVAAVDWPTAQAALRLHGLRPFAGPIGGALRHMPEALPAGQLDALRLDVGEAAARRVVTAWATAATAPSP